MEMKMIKILVICVNHITLREQANKHETDILSLSIKCFVWENLVAYSQHDIQRIDSDDSVDGSGSGGGGDDDDDDGGGS